jgi:hypothetical protein
MFYFAMENLININKSVSIYFILCSFVQKR